MELVIGDHSQEVAFASTGMEEFGVTREVEFAAQALDVDLDEVREGIVGFVPDVF